MFFCPSSHKNIYIYFHWCTGRFIQRQYLMPSFFFMIWPLPFSIKVNHNTSWWLKQQPLYNAVTFLHKDIQVDLFTRSNADWITHFQGCVCLSRARSAQKITGCLWWFNGLVNLCFVKQDPWNKQYFMMLCGTFFFHIYVFFFRDIKQSRPHIWNESSPLVLSLLDLIWHNQPLQRLTFLKSSSGSWSIVKTLRELSCKFYRVHVPRVSTADIKNHQVHFTEKLPWIFALLPLLIIRLSYSPNHLPPASEWSSHSECDNGRCVTARRWKIM